MVGKAGHLRQECRNFPEATCSIHFRFIPSLKQPFKFYPEDRAVRTTSFGQKDATCRRLGAPVGDKGGFDDKHGNGVGRRRTGKRRRLLRSWHGLFIGGRRRG